MREGERDEGGREENVGRAMLPVDNTATFSANVTHTVTYAGIPYDREL